MADYYSGWVNSGQAWRTKMSVSTSDLKDSFGTTVGVTYTVNVYVQSNLVSTGSTGVNWSITIGGHTSSGTKSPSNLSKGATTWIASYSYYIEKTRSNQSIGISAWCGIKMDYSGYRAGLTASTTYTLAQLPSHTVTFNANGGPETPASFTKWYNSIYTIPGTYFSRTGYSFTGYKSSYDGTFYAYNAAGIQYGEDHDDTLYLQWSEYTYTVSFNANGGSGAPGSQTKYHTKNLTLSATKPTRTGYNFNGWSTSSSGSAQYQPGGSFSTNANTTLYAVWSLITYSVTYNANGGSGTTATQTKTYGQNLTLRSNAFTRSQYRFVEWNTKADGTGTTYAAGATYSANAALTLYAIWEPDEFNITYAGDGDGLPSPAVVSAGASYTVPSTAPTRSLYTFGCYIYSGSVTTATSGGVTGTLANGAELNPSTIINNVVSNVTLTARWSYVYTIPSIGALNITRCDADGTYNDEGTYALVEFSWSTCSVKDSKNVNHPVESVVVTLDSVSDSTGIVKDTDFAGTYRHVFGGALSVDNAYTVTVKVADDINTTTSTGTLQNIDLWLDCSPEGGVAIRGIAPDSDKFVVNSATTEVQALAAQSLSATSITDTGELNVSGTTTLNGNTNAKALTCTSLSDSGDATVSGLTTLNGLAVRCWSLGGYAGTGTNQKILLRARQTVNASAASGAINIVGFVGGFGYSDQTKLDVSIPVRGTTTASIKDSSRYSSTASTYAGISAYTNSDGYVEVELWVHDYYKVNLIAYFDPSRIQVIDSAWSTTQASQTTWFWSSANPGITRAVLDAYPVGAVYISYVSTSPASLFGGSWTQITGRFLRAANDVSTGGSDSFSMATKGSQIAKSSTEGTQYGLQVNTTAFAGRIAIANSDTFNKQPAYQDLYVWRRTA